jgi:hypothetical protein
MADVSDKIAELAKGKADPELASIIRDRLPQFVVDCEEAAKPQLQRGIETIKRLDKMGW